MINKIKKTHRKQHTNITNILTNSKNFYSQKSSVQSVTTISSKLICTAANTISRIHQV